MLIGMVRPHESKTFEVRGEEFTDIDATVAEQTPTGWERSGPRHHSEERDHPHRSGDTLSS